MNQHASFSLTTHHRLSSARFPISKYPLPCPPVLCLWPLFTQHRSLSPPMSCVYKRLWQILLAFIYSTCSPFGVYYNAQKVAVSPKSRTNNLAMSIYVGSTFFLLAIAPRCQPRERMFIAPSCGRSFVCFLLGGDLMWGVSRAQVRSVASDRSCFLPLTRLA